MCDGGKKTEVEVRIRRSTLSTAKRNGKRLLWGLAIICMVLLAMVAGAVWYGSNAQPNVLGNLAQIQAEIASAYRECLKHPETQMTQENFQGIYLGAQKAGIDWQTVAALFHTESSCGTNLGHYRPSQILRGDQRIAFERICQETGRNPTWYTTTSGRAGELGPFQFMPLTWLQYGVDADGDGRKDPWNVADASAAAANYLAYEGYQELPWDAVRAYKGGSKGRLKAEQVINKTLRLAQRLGAPLDL